MENNLVPEKLAPHFRASKNAHMLTITALETSPGWLVVRLLGDWLRQCNDPSEVGILLVSFYHPYDHYANSLAHFGINLQAHEARGHFRFIGNIYGRMMGQAGQEPKLTYEQTLELLSDNAQQMRQAYRRTVVIMDAPELSAPFATDDLSSAARKWSITMQDVAYQFNHAILVLSLNTPMDNNYMEFARLMASINGVREISTMGDMNMALRYFLSPDDDADGTIRISYGDDFVPPTSNTSTVEEGYPFKIQPDGRTVKVGGNYYIA